MTKKPATKKATMVAGKFNILLDDAKQTKQYIQCLQTVQSKLEPIFFLRSPVKIARYKERAKMVGKNSMFSWITLNSEILHNV